MTLTLYIVKDADGKPVAGPYAAEADANWRAKSLAAKRPLTVEPHTFATTPGEGTTWPGY